MTAVFGAQWTGVVPLPAITADLKYIREVAAKLDSIAGLRHNWDGEQGNPIESRILAIASELLLPLSRLQPPVPRIAPVLGGGIQFEWEVADRALEIEILPDGSVEYLTAEGGRIEEGRLPELPTNEVRTLAGWVTGIGAVSIEGLRELTPLDYQVPGDLSSAYFIAAASNLPGRR